MPKFGAQVDLQKIPILGLVPESNSTAPTSPVNGQLWYDNAVDKLKIYQAGSWQIATAVTSVAGKTGAVTLVKGDVGLGNVDNTSDAAKPISTATQTALNAKADESITISAGSGLTGGGDLTANRSLAVVFGTASATQAMPGNTPLNSITKPTGFLDMNGKQIANLQSPVSDNDAANKAYVDGLVQGLHAHDSVRVASTGNLSLTAPGTTIDGVTMASGDRVLVKNQTTASENGIYVWMSSTSMIRASDADTADELRSAFVFVEQGTQADSGWLQTADTVTLGTTAITWVQFSGAGQIIAGTGLNKSGNTLSVDFAPSGTSSATQATRADDSRLSNARPPSGAAGGDLSGTYPNPTIKTVTVAKGGTGATDAATARTNLSAAGVYTFSVPALTAGTWTNITHNLNIGSHAPMATFTDATTGEAVVLDVKWISANVAAVKADIAYAASALYGKFIG